MEQQNGGNKIAKLKNDSFMNMDKTNFDEREGLPMAQSFINFSKYRRNKRFFP
jgi:hypothetical protein